MVTHTWHTHALRARTRPPMAGVPDLPVPQRWICRPRRNKQTCHFLFMSKTERLSIILMSHLFVYETSRKRGGNFIVEHQRETVKLQYLNYPALTIKPVLFKIYIYMWKEIILIFLSDWSSVAKTLACGALHYFSDHTKIPFYFPCQHLLLDWFSMNFHAFKFQRSLCNPN